MAYKNQKKQKKYVKALHATQGIVEAKRARKKEKRGILSLKSLLKKTTYDD